ncbi:glutathione transferase GstA [Phenylobacterium sp.]|uniref:glutathione transferase GstA n=1 Tax=Phenylobacterium sp. TaxID=1871053 RepID=UPI002F4238C6
MKLYYAPGACSLAGHIALHEAGLAFDRVKVDLKTHLTEDGRPFMEINPKGYVPALAFDDDQVLTENVAILSWIADRAPALAPNGPMGRYRLLETLAYISTEVHKAFKPFFKPGATDQEKSEAGQQVEKRLGLLEGRLGGGYLFGEQATVADAYLFVMLRWAGANDLKIPERLAAFMGRMGDRPAVRLALRHEGLS